MRRELCCAVLCCECVQCDSRIGVMLRQHKLCIFITPFETRLKSHYKVLHTDLTHTEVAMECKFRHRMTTL